MPWRQWRCVNGLTRDADRSWCSAWRGLSFAGLTGGPSPAPDSTPCDVQELRCVVRSPHSKMQHVVIAGALAFVSQPAAGDPDQRVEPVDCTHDTGDDLHHP